ncbi:hypothetical protein J2046_002074 [Rhizobium petrolearium]|uniref:peptidoglycan-binding domain-containing protein n=1 Tax=Neorhizobium petrolearium TaxID=515361 RepID=UPI001AE46513|nr:peptidoglycan-binding domain-containing protein [Neorhizobium petrolearium]MBP1843818.1 hypothetical protein [Neorhizobium petrolearium]
MAARKRKSPDRRKPVQQPGLLSSLLSAAGRAAARHPRPVIGVAAFIVVFSFVAANALWYQPGGHPAPFLATRDASDPNAIAGYRPVRRATPEEVTTFRIERADPDAPASSPATTAPETESVAAPLSDPLPVAVPAPRPETIQREAREAAPQPAPQKPAPIETAKAAPAKPARPASSSKAVPVSRPPEKVAAVRNEDPVAAAIRSAERRPVMRPPAEIPSTGSTPRTPRATPVAQKPAASSSSADLVLQIQRGLSNIAYADVAVDGVAGEQTKAAIRRFQKHYRLPETGEPDEMVLKKLKSIGAL